MTIWMTLQMFQHFMAAHLRSLDNNLAISGAAVAFANALASKSPKGAVIENKTTNEETGIISPRRAVELRMKNFEHLRYLQELLDDKILTQDEYIEQKQAILSSLRKL